MSQYDEHGMNAPLEATPKKVRRGFATMDRTKIQAIAKKGGVAAHAAGTAHEFTPEKAREAGRKGGLASQAKRRTSDGSGGAPMTPA